VLFAWIGEEFEMKYSNKIIGVPEDSLVKIFIYIQMNNFASQNHNSKFNA